MKVTSFIHWAVTIALAVFTVLYFVKPRKIPVQPPVEIHTVFEKVPPDTVYLTTIKWRPAPPAPQVVDTSIPFQDTTVVASRASFSKTLQDIKVSSIVTAYGSTPVMAFDNNIDVTFDAAKFRESVIASLPKKKSRFFLGVGVGIGASALTYSIISLSR